MYKLKFDKMLKKQAKNDKLSKSKIGERFSYSLYLKLKNEST